MAVSTAWGTNANEEHHSGPSESLALAIEPERRLQVGSQTIDLISPGNDADLELCYPELQSEAFNENLNASLPWYSPNKDSDSNGDTEDTLSDSLEHRRVIPVRLQKQKEKRASSEANHSSTMSKKRTALQPDTTALPKRLRRSYAWGPSDPRWGGVQVKNTPPCRAQDTDANDTDNVDYSPGGFDSDESDDLPTKVQRRKNEQTRFLTVKKPFGSANNKVGHTMGSAPLRNIAPRKAEHFPHKLKQRRGYDLSDLPLRGGDHIKTWNTNFVPMLVAWAGANDDPFKLNSELFTAVPHIWERTFPTIVLPENKLLALIKVSEKAIESWIDEIGRSGYMAVRDYIQCKPGMEFAEDRAAFAAGELRNRNYVYRCPEKFASKEAFRSPLVLKVFSVHEHRISQVLPPYRCQFGALALATAAVERGLRLFEAGRDDQAERDLLRREQAPYSSRTIGFIEPLWGETTRDLIQETRKLVAKDWKEISFGCKRHLQVLHAREGDIQSDEDHPDERHQNPGLHARIQIHL